MIIGYIRTTAGILSMDKQAQILTANNCEVVYKDIGFGSNLDRPELTRMLSEIQQGDVILVCDRNRISRNVVDLVMVTEEIKEKGASIQFLS